MTEHYLGEGLPLYAERLTEQQKKALIDKFKFPASILNDPRRLKQNLTYRLQLHQKAVEEIERQKKWAEDHKKKPDTETGDDDKE